MDEFVSMKKFIKLAAVAGMHISVAAFGQSESQDVSLNEVRKLTDQTLLAKIAVENKSALTRSTAAEKLTNQVLLEKIAVEDKDAMVRWNTVKMLTDPVLLAKIAVADADSNVRYMAVGEISDRTLLAEIALADKDWKVRETCVHKILDQTFLEKIAVEDMVWMVRIAALKKLTNQTMLAKIAVDDKNVSVRSAATKRLSDKAALARDTEANSVTARQSAVEKLADQSASAKIAVEDKDKDWLVRIDAVRKLTDQELLAKIATEDQNRRVRNDATQKLTNQVALARIAVEDKDFSVRWNAVEKLTDLNLLAGIALKDEEWHVRKTAAAKLTDQSLLAKIAVEDKEWAVRGAAIRKLTDQPLLAKISKEDKDLEARSFASETLAKLTWPAATAEHGYSLARDYAVLMNQGPPINTAPSGGNFLGLVSDHGSTSFDPKADTSGVEVFDKDGLALKFAYAHRMEITGGAGENARTLVYYLNTESDFIGLANTKPGITNFTWNNSNVNVRFFLIRPNTYRPRGGSVVVLWGEMLRGVFDTQRNWLPLSIATSWIGTADIPQGLTKSDQKLHARIDKVLRYDGSAVVLPSAIADSVRAADVPTGLRLLDNWDNVQWYNPILTDKEQLSQKGTLLLGASINRNMVAINVDGFWVIGAAANIYDNANKVSDHSLTGDFEKLTPDQQTQIKTILLNLYILTPVGMEKPKERK